MESDWPEIDFEIKSLRKRAEEAEARCKELERHLANIYQDQCENAYVEASVADSFRQALHEVAPDHPALKGAPPSFGVWESLSKRVEELEKIDEYTAQKLTAHAEAVGVDPDHIDYIEETTKAIIAMWAKNSELQAQLAKNVKRKQRSSSSLAAVLMAARSRSRIAISTGNSQLS